MADNINTHNSQIIIDEEVGSGGTYNINGHNNSIKIKGVWVNKITVMGHNNSIKGTDDCETINKLVVLGHNNSFNYLHIGQLEVCGFNNSLKNITYEVMHNETSNGEYQDESEDDSSSSDEQEYQQSFNIHTGMGDVNNFVSNISTQIGDMLSNLNISHNVTFNIGGNAYEVASSDSDSDSGEYDDEEDKNNYYDEPQNEEAEITPEERNMIINAISSYSYDTSGKDEENCAVCLCKLEQRQQVKCLPCAHIFHSKCINSWMKEKLICPCCKARVDI